MKKMILRLIVPMIAAVALTIASAEVPQNHDPEGHGGAMEGSVWDSQVTLTDCNGHTLAVFRAVEMFNAGGTLNSIDNTPPTLHGPGFGTWERTGPRTFRAPFQFFNFNADGSFAGTQKIERQIHVAAHGNSYTSMVTFGAYDPDGNLVFSGCGSEIATRRP
jgi:hypothetical protein